MRDAPGGGTGVGTGRSRVISRRSMYGLSALLVLARQRHRQLVLISDLARAANAPKKFLGAILLALKRRNIVRSRKGPGGGYALARRPNDITFGEVIRVFEKSLAPLPCASRSVYRRCQDCPDENTCGVRMTMLEVGDAIGRAVDGLTLSDMIRRIDRAAARRDPT